ncbi:MAG: MIP family channel protein [Streptosporangiales bacterium]|nr:MIP family channel protein [Streptosporangiales bacterium]
MAVDIPPLIAKGSGLKRLGGLRGELVAEFLGTLILIAFGDGVVAAAVAGLPGSGRTEGPTTFFLGAGDWLLITWGWALAVTLAVYVAGGVSGAHINPAVTLAFAIRRKFPWRKVAPYMIAQVLGGFAGAALVYLVYFHAIKAFDAAAEGPKINGHTNTTLTIFSTAPAPYFNGSVWGPLIDQIVGTMFLVIFIVAIIDLRNTAVKANLGPLLIGFAVAAIGMSFGANAGYAINPARDFGPRLFAWTAGWGEFAMPGSVDGAYSAYFWIPIIGPLVGGAIGILIYDLLIGNVLHARALASDGPGGQEPPGRTTETTDAVDAAATDSTTSSRTRPPSTADEE